MDREVKADQDRNPDQHVGEPELPCAEAETHAVFVLLLVGVEYLCELFGDYVSFGDDDISGAHEAESLRDRVVGLACDQRGQLLVEDKIGGHDVIDARRPEYGIDPHLREGHKIFLALIYFKLPNKSLIKI